MTDSLYPASLQKLHELDERARGVPGALFDHLDLADSHAGESGKACSRVTTSLADGAESFGGHLDYRTFCDMPTNSLAIAVRNESNLVTIPVEISFVRVIQVGFRLWIGGCAKAVADFIEHFFGDGNHSNSPKSKGAEGLAATALAFMQSMIERGNIAAIFDKVHDMPVKFFVGKFAKIHGLPSHISGRISLHVAKGNKVITSADCFGRSRLAVQDNCAGFFNFLFDGHLSISVPDDTLLTHNVHSVKHKVRTNDDLLREAA